MSGLAQYRYETWTAESGLPQNIVRGVTQTSDGYLWVATLDGVARFDGMRFTVFNKSNTPGIASNRFSAIVKGENDDLWLSDESGGLNRYHEGAFHSYRAEDGLPTNSVRGISADAAGNVWVLSGESILAWNRTSGDLVDVTPQPAGIHYEALQWDNAGFWGVDRLGLHIFHRGELKTYASLGKLPASTVARAALDPSGAIWLELIDGRQAIIGAGKQNAELVAGTHPQSIFGADLHGHSWTVGVGRQLSRSMHLPSSKGPATIPLRCFLEDREGNLWIGTEGDGLYRLQEQSINVLSRAQGLAASNIYPVFQDRAGAIWLGAWPYGLSRYADGRFTNFALAPGNPGRLITALTQDRNGHLWVAGHGGLGAFQAGRVVEPSGINLPGRAVVQAIFEDRGGTLWIGTSDGLLVYRGGPGRTLTVQDGLATNDVRVIVQSDNGDIWVGGYGGLTRIRNGQFMRWSERDGLPSDNIRAIYEDREGVFWIGTYDGGLGRMQDGRLTRYRERDGLFSNGVFQILEDGHRNLWMSSNRGIYRVSKDDLRAFAEGRQSTIFSVAYGKSDGLLNVECNGGTWPAGIKARDGKLWFPTQDGVAVINPETLHGNPQPPPVRIERVLVDQSPASPRGLLKILPGRQYLEVEYTALSFVHSEQIRFRYMLEGLDTDWVDAGPRRTAYYSHLPPGSYTFHVIARNSDGVWNSVGQSLRIDVLAPFYRRWWFTASAAGLLLLLALAIMRNRVLQLERKQSLQKAFSQQLISSQENERSRIATELHDSLGQRLVVINQMALLSLRSKRKDSADAARADPLEEISAEARSAIQEVREISYNLRPFQLDRLGLTKAVEGLARSIAAASGVAISAEVDNIDDAFPENLRINFYRIVQESLNNMMKHAAATYAEVRITRNAERVTLSIRDNGRGFTPDGRVSRTDKSGFGTTGMVERAHLLGGSFRIRSAPGQGTENMVDVPLGGKTRG